MKVTRREFMKGAAAGAAGVAAMSVTGLPVLADEEMEMAAEPKWSWEVKPDPIPDDEIVETIEAEVVVLGAGTAGVAAACSCAENGLDTIVVEKTELPNGRGGGVGACNSRLNKELGYEIEPVAAQYPLMLPMRDGSHSLHGCVHCSLLNKI